MALIAARINPDFLIVTAAHNNSARVLTTAAARLPDQGALTAPGPASDRPLRAHVTIPLEELMVAAPIGLGVGQCSVRILQKSLGTRTIIGVHGDACAHRDTQMVMVNAVGCAQCREYLIRAQGRIFRAAHFREQNHEFVSAVTADGV